MLAPMIIYAFTYSNGYAIQLLMRVGNILQYTARKHNNHTYRRCKKMYLLQHFSNILALRIKHNKVRKRRTFTTFYFPDNFWQASLKSVISPQGILVFYEQLWYIYILCVHYSETYLSDIQTCFHLIFLNVYSYIYIYIYRYRSKKK